MREFGDNISQEDIQKQKELLQVTDHPHVIQAYKDEKGMKESHLILEDPEYMNLATVEKQDIEMIHADYLYVMQQITEGVMEIHKHGYTHGNIWLGNIHMTSQGEYDRAFLGEPIISTIKKAEIEKNYCSLMEIAPEVLAGEGELTQKTDAYALGATMYRLFRGKGPVEYFKDDCRHLKEDWKSEEIKSLSFDPVHGRMGYADKSDLNKIFCKSMNKNPEKRYQSAEEFYGDLVSFIESTRWDKSYMKNTKLQFASDRVEERGLICIARPQEEYYSNPWALNRPGSP